MQGEIFTSLLMPASLAFIMFSLGLGLTPGDFGHIIRQPRALLVGVFCHFVLLPLACFGLVKLTGITGVFAVGFMILASCPTGTTSNVLTYIARGDVALALSFTAVASVLTIFTLPLIVSFSLEHFAGTSQTVSVPAGAMMVQVFMMMALPVAAGMIVRQRVNAWALRMESRATKIATALFLLIIIGAAVRNWPLLRDNFSTLAPLAIWLNLTMLLCGFLIARAVHLPWRQSVTLGIESAVQNSSLAMVIAGSVLRQEAMVVPGAIYGVLMYAGGLVFAFAMRRFTMAEPESALSASSAAMR